MKKLSTDSARNDQGLAKSLRGIENKNIFGGAQGMVHGVRISSRARKGQSTLQEHAMSSSFRTIPAAVAALSLLALCAAADSAQARNIHRSGTFTTGAGKTGSYSGSVTGNLRNGLTRSTSVTNASGQTWNRTATKTYDPSTGAFNKTVTSPNGTTRTYTGTAADGQRSGTYTTSTGKSGSFTDTVTANGNDSVTRNTSITNAAGQTVQRSATTGYDPSTNTVTRSVTGPEGNTRQGSVTFTPSSN